MAAYIIAMVEVTDVKRYAEYTKLTPAAIARHGGRFVVRGGPVTTLEGPPETRRVVVIEFPSRDQANAFYHSEEYTKAKSLREGAAKATFILVNGCGNAR